MQLLQETFVIENLQILTEGKNSDVTKISGIFGRCNEKNNNGRIYPLSVLQSQLEKVAPLIAERRLCGELDHPQNDTVKLSNASHLITKLEMKGNDLMGEAELLKTPAGLTAQALINGGVKIGISSRGMGTLSEDQNGDKIVNEDFKLVTFDLVADPSTRGAYPGLSESTEGKFARETQSRLQKEDNFVTLLKSRMRDAYQPFIEEANGAKVAAAGETKQDVGGMSPEQMRVANLRTTRTAVAGGKHASVLRRKKGLLASTEGEFALIKADGHWHKMAYALQDRLHEIVAAMPDEDISRDLLDRGDEPGERGVGFLRSERARERRKNIRSVLRTSRRQERFKTKEGARRIKKFRGAERKQDLKDTRQRTGRTDLFGLYKKKGTVEREAEAEGKATKIKGAAGGAAKGMSAAQEKIETAKGARKAAKITSGGRRAWSAGILRRKGTAEIEARGTERATDVTAAGEERRASRKHAGTESRKDDEARRVNRRADDAAAAETRRGHREVRRGDTERLKSKVHGTAVDAAIKTGQVAKKTATVAGEGAVGGLAKAIPHLARGAGRLAGAVGRRWTRARSAGPPEGRGPKEPPKVPAEHREETPRPSRNGAPHPGQPLLPAGKQPPREVKAEVVDKPKPLELGRGASTRDPDLLKKVAAGGRSGQRHGQGLRGGGIAAASDDRSEHEAARGARKPVPSSFGARSTAEVGPGYEDKLKTQAHMRRFASKPGASPDEGGGPGRPKAGRQSPGNLGQRRRARLGIEASEYHRMGSLLAEILEV